MRSFSLDRVQRLSISAILVTVGALAACVFPPSTRAATPNWSPVPLAGGGMSNLVRYDPANGSYVLMGDDTGGIQYSSDGGNTWQTRARAVCPHSDYVASIVWNPTLSNVAYALVGDGKYGCLLVSTDYGLDWSTPPTLWLETAAILTSSILGCPHRSRVRWEIWWPSTQPMASSSALSVTGCGGHRFRQREFPAHLVKSRLRPPIEGVTTFAP